MLLCLIEPLSIHVQVSPWPNTCRDLYMDVRGPLCIAPPTFVPRLTESTHSTCSNSELCFLSSPGLLCSAWFPAYCHQLGYCSLLSRNWFCDFVCDLYKQSPHILSSFKVFWQEDKSSTRYRRVKSPPQISKQRIKRGC